MSRNQARRSTSLSIERVLREKRDQILRIARKHGAHNVRVFGSAVQGGATGKSDIDFLVEATDEIGFAAGGAVMAIAAREITSRNSGLTGGPAAASGKRT